MCDVLGIDSVTPPPMTYDDIIEGELDSSTPALFITTPGADITKELGEYAVKGKTRARRLYCRF